MEPEEEEFTADGDWRWWMNLFLVLVPFHWLYWWARHLLSGGRWPRPDSP